MNVENNKEPLQEGYKSSNFHEDSIGAKTPVTHSKAALIHSLKSAAVLIIIAVAAVLSLSLLDHFIPKYVPKLDLKTVALINAAAPHGTDDQTALDEKYYVIRDVDLEKFNKENGDKENKVLSVYFAERGESEGVYIVETQTEGFNKGIIILTAFSGGKITGVALRSAKESPETVDVLTDANFYKVKDAVVGISTDAISQTVNTKVKQQSATYSANGIAKNLNLSALIYKSVAEGK